MLDKFKRIRVLSADHLNLARGKYVPSAMAHKGKISACVGIYAVDYKRDLIPAPGSGMDKGLPDLSAVYNIDEVRTGWEQDTGVVVADLYSAGEPLPLCGRGVLKKALADWKALGYNVKIGIELEAYVFQRDNDGKWVPYDTPGAYVYGTGPSVDPEGLMDTIWEEADRLKFPIETICSEYDCSQFEFALEYDDALTALDNLFLFRQMSKELLIKRGFLFSYMPKPISDRGGSGMHLNISLCDEQGNNLLDDPGADDGLAEMVKPMVAGLVKHHASLAALMCPTVNSYKRLRPTNICGYAGNWGYDHRLATTRIPPERGNGTRIEHRLADCASNPYIATAAALQACLLGYTKKYPLPEPEASEDFEAPNMSIVVPDTMGEGLNILEADTDLSAAIGQPMVDHFLAIKRKEWNDYLDHTTDWEMDTYLEFI
jgi:glutamine synthetase